MNYFFYKNDKCLTNFQKNIVDISGNKIPSVRKIMDKPNKSITNIENKDNEVESNINTNNKDNKIELNK